MNRLKYQALVSSIDTTPQQLTAVAELASRANLQQLFELLLFLQHGLGPHSSPHTQTNCSLVILALLRQPNYPLVMILEHAILEILKQPSVAAIGKPRTNAYDYFEKKGFDSNKGELQTLSYQFTHQCLEICLLLANVKPKRYYRVRQGSGNSLCKEWELQLQRQGLDQTHRLGMNKYQPLSLRKAFLGKLVQFNKSPHAYVDFFMQQMELFLISNSSNSYLQWFRQLAKEGDVYLTSEALARLGEIFCYHKNFSVRRNALQLLNQLVFWGDLEALLLLNFTDYFAIVGSKVAEAQRRKQKTGHFCLYPEIDGQVREKELFLHEFLLCVSRLSSVFPSLDSYFVDSGQAPIYQLYLQLLQKKVEFPQEQDREAYELKMLKNFRLKKEHNFLFLEELDKQKQKLELNPLRPTLRQLQEYSQKNKRNLQQFRLFGDLRSPEWEQLQQFRRHFQEYLERMPNEGSEKEVQSLIEEGMSLQYQIQQLQQLAQQMKIGSINEAEFRQHMEKRFSVAQKEPSFNEKASQLLETLKGQEKENLKCWLTPSAELIKEKMGAKVLSLAHKRTDHVGEVSHLELNSRPFLANQIHGQSIINDMVPALHLHPLRRQKRNQAGLRLTSQQKKKQPIRSPSEKNRKTPKFGSAITFRKRSEPQIGSQQQLKRYDKYLKYLQNREILKQLTAPAYESAASGLQFKRDKLILTGNKVKIVYTLTSQNIEKINYAIHEEPSLRITHNYYTFSNTQAKLTLQAELVKFGFSLPTLSLLVPDAKPTILHPPFALHNFLIIAQTHTYSRPTSQKWAASLSLRAEFARGPEPLKNYLPGVQVMGGVGSGGVRLSSWECNLFVEVREGKLQIEIERADQKQKNILSEILPLLLLKLMTERQGELSSP